MQSRLRYAVYGRDLELRREGGAWAVYDLGNEGKIRPAQDVRVPPEVAPDELGVYLADLLHESATERYPGVAPIPVSSPGPD